MAKATGPAIFLPGGALASTHERYEYRLGQAKMAEAVAEAITGRTRLIAEAGTGTGKTLAYLIPLLQSGQGAILSTGTKALQSQLLERELPIAMQACGRAPRLALLKGRENYLCRKRLIEFSVDPRLSNAREAALFRQLSSWAPQTKSGDRAELDGLPDDSPLWRSVDGRSDHCTGRDCGEYDRCHVYAARQAALGADLVVVNHHLLFAELALREKGAPGVLPPQRLLVLDEAHLVPEVAALHFGRRLSSRMLIELARDAEKELSRCGRLLSAAQALEPAAREFFAAIRPAEGRIAFDPAQFEEQHAAVLERLAAAMHQLASAVAGGGERSEERALLTTRCREIGESLALLTSPGTSESVTTVEAIGKETTVLANWPIDLGPKLEAVFHDSFDTVIATSATLAVAGKLSRAVATLGLPEARTLIVSSPFDHARQAALYVPRQFPEPSEARYGERVVREIEALLQITDGRALLLFASHRALQRTARELRGSLPWSVLVQGEAPREQLIEQFRADRHSVLLGTASFREGIDVPGDALSLVVVDKLPFAVPDDPLVKARATLLQRRGQDPFHGDQLPEAILDLRQALGRLLRSKSDRGLMAVLDIRLRTRRYGSIVLDSLPPWPLLEDLEQARRWWRASGN